MERGLSTGDCFGAGVAVAEADAEAEAEAEAAVGSGEDESDVITGVAGLSRGEGDG